MKYALENHGSQYCGKNTRPGVRNVPTQSFLYPGELESDLEEFT